MDRTSGIVKFFSSMLSVQIAMGFVVCISIFLFVVNAVRFGADIPGGILNLFSIIVGAIFTPEAIRAYRRKEAESEQRRESETAQSLIETGENNGPRLPD